MDQGSPAPLEQEEVQHHRSESRLHKRRPSKQEDEQLLAGMSSPLDAARLRRAVPEEQHHTLHTPVEFSWKQFWITLLYEVLPPGLVAPLAVLLVERSRTRAWHVVNHRFLFVWSLKHNPRGNHILFWCFFCPLNWLVLGALLLRLLGPEHLVQNVDLFQIVLANLLLFLRVLIVSVKYGYFRPEEIEQLSRPAPDWDADQTERRLVGNGWTNPGKYPGLIEDELTCAMDESDVALQGVSFQLDESASDRLRKHPTDERFTAATARNTKDEVTTGFVLHQLLSRAYHPDFPSRYMLCVLVSFLMITASTFLIRWGYGLSAFGETIWEILIFVGCVLGFLLGGFSNFSFGMISAHDFQRRATVLEKLGQLAAYPGLRLGEFLFHKPEPQDGSKTEAQEPSTNDSEDAQVFVDLKRSANVFAWMLCRKVLRSFGEAYYQRIQAYTSILLGYAICCVLFLNLIGWTQMRHHVSTIWLLLLIIGIISSICVFAISKATKLQGLAADQRSQVQAELLFLEKELADLPTGTPEAKREELLSAKALLRQVDESIHYEELIHRPVRVMGHPATHNVIGSALGIILTGFVLAAEGFAGSGIAYDAQGWFNY